MSAFSDFRTGEPIIDRWLDRHGKYALKYRSAAIYVSTIQDGTAAGFYLIRPEYPVLSRSDRAGVNGRVLGHIPNVDS